MASSTARIGLPLQPEAGWAAFRRKVVEERQAAVSAEDVAQLRHTLEVVQRGDQGGGRKYLPRGEGGDRDDGLEGGAVPADEQPVDIARAEPAMVRGGRGAAAAHWRAIKGGLQWLRDEAVAERGGRCQTLQRVVLQEALDEVAEGGQGRGARGAQHLVDGAGGGLDDAHALGVGAAVAEVDLDALVHLLQAGAGVALGDEDVLHDGVLARGDVGVLGGRGAQPAVAVGAVELQQRVGVGVGVGVGAVAEVGRDDGAAGGVADGHVAAHGRLVVGGQELLGVLQDLGADAQVGHVAVGQHHEGAVHLVLQDVDGRHAEQADHGGHESGVVVAGEQDALHVNLAEDAPQTPEVDLRVVGEAENDLGGAVGAALDVAAEALLDVAAGAEVDELHDGGVGAVVEDDVLGLQVADVRGDLADGAQRPAVPAVDVHGGGELGLEREGGVDFALLVHFAGGLVEVGAEDFENGEDAAAEVEVVVELHDGAALVGVGGVEDLEQVDLVDGLADGVGHADFHAYVCAGALVAGAQDDGEGRVAEDFHDVVALDQHVAHLDVEGVEFAVGAGFAPDEEAPDGEFLQPALAAVLAREGFHALLLLLAELLHVAGRVVREPALHLVSDCVVGVQRAADVALLVEESGRVRVVVVGDACGAQLVVPVD
ncbi:dual-specificity tyrosine- -phosphorylation regulated kinase 1b [Babesia caballi]|uniref:Dual-specificity tyrosine- -phosphorylation regulated kinase 1b n=1 Tax=Babesia caballi TaxID=5871 RepID=A0AAV4LNA8_BABCB|nr:dual-specificity tyrosine- -phosphorylation regulated kinase 1b [Babesia caballi]